MFDTWKQENLVFSFLVSSQLLWKVWKHRCEQSARQNISRPAKGIFAQAPRSRSKGIWTPEKTGDVKKTVFWLFKVSRCLCTRTKQIQVEVHSWIQGKMEMMLLALWIMTWDISGMKGNFLLGGHLWRTKYISLLYFSIFLMKCYIFWLQCNINNYSSVSIFTNSW